MTNVEDEVKNQACYLLHCVVRKRLSLADVERRLGWSAGQMTSFISEWTSFKVEDLYLVLEAIDVRPEDFFFDCYRIPRKRSIPMIQLTDVRRADECRGGDPPEGLDIEPNGAAERPASRADLPTANSL